MNLFETTLALTLMAAITGGALSTFNDAKAQAEQYAAYSTQAAHVATEVPYDLNSPDVDEFRALAAELAKKEKENAQNLIKDNDYIYAEDL